MKTAYCWLKMVCIDRIGDTSQVLKGLSSIPIDQEIDCRGACMIPGFVDPHTHLCFAYRREEEFNMRIAGTPYLEILNQGGGILSSVKAVHEANETELLKNTLIHALSALSFGTTTVEIKSGYGLDTPNELKMLRVIEQVGRYSPLDVVPTFLGAHAIPEDFQGRPNDFVDLVIEEMLPAVVRNKKLPAIVMCFVRKVYFQSIRAGKYSLPQKIRDWV
jgi:imidazolonepropionase